jgi:putative transposase
VIRPGFSGVQKPCHPASSPDRSYIIMAKFFHPLLTLLASATESQLAQYVEFLKAENRILRSKLPKCVICTPSERDRLVKLGKPLGAAIKDLITIVTPRSFARWASGGAKKYQPATAKEKRKPGRPRTPEAIRELILQMAKDNGWGLGRILGELKKLGIKAVSKSTVRNILKKHGYDPDPRRGEGMLCAEPTFSPNTMIAAPDVSILRLCRSSQP